MKPKTLIINSYGGSIMIGAQQAGHPIIASMENANYGLPSQRLNYPNERYIPFEEDWPLDLDLHDSIAIAHPPCAGFSNQNRSPDIEKGRGLKSGAFNCTVRLLEYLLPRAPVAVAIESVVGAMDGAWQLHEHYAGLYGYRTYRVLQNAASFGTPQWRKRFWVIFVRKELGSTFTFRIHHNVRLLDEALAGITDTEVLKGHMTRWEDQLRRFENAGITPEQQQKLLSTPGCFTNTVPEMFNLKKRSQERADFLYKAIVAPKYGSVALYVLNPNDFAPTLLGCNWWYYKGAMLGLQGYKAIMGFPVDYQFHAKQKTLELLSKGVCPPVASWVLRQIDENLFGERPDDIKYDRVETIHPGDVCDLNFKKSEALKFRGRES